MGEGLAFGTQVNDALEMAYKTPDIVAARQAVVKALSLELGQSVLDIGSGPGLLAADMAQHVGQQGNITGIDLSESMLASAAKLCEDLPWVKFEEADAMLLPYADNSFDRVVSTQVYEYVSDLEGALAEFARVLKPGGYGVIVDTDWAFPYWNTVDDVIRDRMIDAWKAHCAQESVPLRLPAAIKSANLQLNNIQALPILNAEYAENSFSYWLSKIISEFAVGRDGLTQTDADTWIDDLQTVNNNGEYLFCINRYLFEIKK